MKLIKGQQNALYTVCKAGYAEGVMKPRREVKAEVKPLVTKIRKNEPLVA